MMWRWMMRRTYDVACSNTGSCTWGTRSGVMPYGAAIHDRTAGRYRPGS